MTHPAWTSEVVTEIAARHAGREGALLPLLHEIQHTFGFVPDPAVPLIAHALNLSRAEVHGVLTFYHDFRRKPAGKRVLKLCRAEACQARGGDSVQARIESGLGLSMGETRADGAVTLEPVFCLGLCASGPAALLDGEPVARLYGGKIDDLIAELVR